jgi:hypothetical protein
MRWIPSDVLATTMPVHLPAVDVDSQRNGVQFMGGTGTLHDIYWSR